MTSCILTYIAVTSENDPTDPSLTFRLLNAFDEEAKELLQFKLWDTAQLPNIQRGSKIKIKFKAHPDRWVKPGSMFLQWKLRILY